MFQISSFCQVLERLLRNRFYFYILSYKGFGDLPEARYASERIRYYHFGTTSNDKQIKLIGWFFPEDKNAFIET